jgi:hypothetical protein
VSCKHIYLTLLLHAHLHGHERSNINNDGTIGNHKGKYPKEKKKERWELD